MNEQKLRDLSIILQIQNEVVDAMLEKQNKLHEAVVNRQWVNLENCISDMETFGNAFVELDKKRELLCHDVREIMTEKELEVLFLGLRTKLTKSRIENEALKVYVETSQDLIEGVIEECFPQDHSAVYNRYGALVKGSNSSGLLDTIL